MVKGSRKMIEHLL